MTEKQKRAADLYLELGDWKRAMEQAGYRRGDHRGFQQKPDVRQYLERRAREKPAGEEEVLRFLSGVMRGEDPDAGVKERMRAAELLGRKLGAFGNDSTGQSGPVVIVDDVP